MQTRGTFPELNAGMKKRARKTPSVQRQKMTKVMEEFETGALHSGSKTGKKVTNRKQAIAIGISEGKKAAAGGYDTASSMFAAKRAPRRINAPKTLAGRRAASHIKAYPR
jgi:hypothetical protein